jgi:hypothetical protein
LLLVTTLVVGHSLRYPKIIVDCVEAEQELVDGVEVPVDTSMPNPNEMEFDNLYLVRRAAGCRKTPEAFASHMQMVHQHGTVGMASDANSWLCYFTGHEQHHPPVLPPRGAGASASRHWTLFGCGRSVMSFRSAVHHGDSA